MQLSKTSLILTILLLCLGHFLVDVMIGIWPIYKTIAHLDLALAGIIAGACAFMGEGLQVLFGSLSDRGYRKMLILGGLLATTASVLLVYTGSYWMIFLLYLITCAGSGAFHPAAASLASELSPRSKGLLISLFTSGGAFGMAFSQLLFTSSHRWFSGHVIWLAVPAFLLVLITFLSRIAHQPPQISNATAHFDIKIFKKFFSYAPLRHLYFTQVCSSSILWGVMFLLPDLLSSREYEPWIAFGGGHMMLILGSAFMMIPAGYLADRYSSRTVILFAMMMSLIFLYTLLFFPLLSNVALLALLFVLGASLGVVQPVGISLGTQFAAEHKGMISAFLMGMVWCVSEGIGQAGGGYLTTFFTNDAPAKAIALLGMILFLGCVFSYLLPKDEKVTMPVDVIAN